MELRHLLRINDFSSEELHNLLNLAIELKNKTKAGEEHELLRGKSLAMIFEKPSNRTRMSFEVGMFQLGGRAISVQNEEIRMGKREAISDVARVLSGYVDAVMIRANYHWSIVEFAKYSSVPVINGLSDHYHPCQALADILTVKENKPDLTKTQICYIGDGNNVCNSLIAISTALEIPLTICTPPGYEPHIKTDNPLLTFESDPQLAVKDADVLYTDVWTSMGQEATSTVRMADFRKYTITLDLLNQAKPDAIFMHCLPAKRGFEVQSDVLESPQSIVWEQAENRMHAQKALLVKLLT